MIWTGTITERGGRGLIVSAAAAVVFAVVAVMGTFVGSARAAGAPTWQINALSQPSIFSAARETECESTSSCAALQVVVANVGNESSSGGFEVTAQLPEGITTRATPEDASPSELELGRWECTPGAGLTTVKCTLLTLEEPPEPMSVPVGRYTSNLAIPVTAAELSAPTSLTAHIKVSGGGAIHETTEELPIDVSAPPPAFGISRFKFSPHDEVGDPSGQAGGHPWSVEAAFGVPDEVKAVAEGSSPYTPVRNVRNISFELPAGFIGDPQAVPACTELELRLGQCSSSSKIGIFAVSGSALARGQFGTTGLECCSAIYNIKPEAGYPAEFGLTFAHVPVFMFATLVHTATGYRLRVTVPGLPETLEVTNASATFFGAPGLVDESGLDAALLTNPSNCAGGPLSARLVLDTWAEPESPAVGEDASYPGVTNCRALQFRPTFGFEPAPGNEGGTHEADTPSAYTAELSIPQSESYDELATPPLRTAYVTLPAGVTLNPAAAVGLVGCSAEGPGGINIGSDKVAANGRDEGDPEAIELGAGHAGGNGSFYDDGLYHTAHGHCPSASQIGTVEVFTPLLPTRCGGEGQPMCKSGESPAPLQGHVYLAQPKCGGAGQPACTEASATNGELFGLYIEAEGSGVIVKLAGTVAADPSTGQLTATFKENPQLPFSELRLHFHGGPRAPLANPQACGSFATTSTLTSWAGQEASGPSPAFSIDWDGKGGACPSGLPFVPGFSAGTTSPAAGAFSPFTLSFARNDREQDLSGLSVTLPPGLLAKIAGVPLCGEAQANAGTCGPESQIGSASVLAGAGEHPLYVSGGRVYLTTGYKGQPFGLSIVVPAVAGPFNLGDVIVRASIHIDPNTGQVTVTSDPLPQSRDGVPFRLRTVHTEINRPGGFTFNPTNCSEQQVTGTLTGAQGAKASVSSPFAATGCAALPFKPTFTASTSGKTSKANGASLVVKVAQRSGEANIHKVDLQLPLALPSRLTTLQKACTEAQFNVNPAGCPEGSFIGTAKAVTPVLNVPLVGPAILVSHGGAAFPDVEFLLQGEGVEIILDGKTDIKKGITYSKFDTVPDAPISSFETTLPEGPHSALAAYGNLCAPTKTVTVTKHVRRRIHGHIRHLTVKVERTVAGPLLMPTTIVGQNGAQVTESTSIAVTGCRPVTISKRKLVGKSVVLAFNLTAKGTVTATGYGLKRYRKTLSAGVHQIKVALSKAGLSARRRHRKIMIRVALKTGSTTSSAATALRL